MAGQAGIHTCAESGAIVETLSLEDDLFGHFGPTDGDVLYLLGWRNVIAVDSIASGRKR